MSVAEFALAGMAAIPLLCTGHELCRILIARHSAQLVLESAVSKAALGSLEHIAKGTFSEPYRENSFSQSASHSVQTLFQSPVLHWSFFRPPASAGTSPLGGIRTTSTGPTRDSPQRPVDAKSNLCIRSWLEPLIQFVSEKRNCLGQFRADGAVSDFQAIGIPMHIEARHKIPLTVDIYLNIQAKKKE
ncbi:MAG: hypothetical protein RIR26_1210 [Pseudomonadota bacterium]